MLRRHKQSEAPLFPDEKIEVPGWVQMRHPFAFAEMYCLISWQAAILVVVLSGIGREHSRSLDLASKLGVNHAALLWSAFGLGVLAACVLAAYWSGVLRYYAEAIVAEDLKPISEQTLLNETWLRTAWPYGIYGLLFVVVLILWLTNSAWFEPALIFSCAGTIALALRFAGRRAVYDAAVAHWFETGAPERLRPLLSIAERKIRRQFFIYLSVFTLLAGAIAAASITHEHIEARIRSEKAEEGERAGSPILER